MGPGYPHLLQRIDAEASTQSLVGTGFCSNTQIPGLLKIRHIGKTTVSTGAVGAAPPGKGRGVWRDRVRTGAAEARERLP